MNESICWWALRGSQGCHYSAFFSPFAYPETDGIRSLPNWRLGNTSSPVLIWRLFVFFYICVFSILDMGHWGCSKFGHWVLLKLIGFFRDFFSPIPIWTLGIANIGWGLQSSLSVLEISFELGIASLIWVHRLVFSEVKSYTVQPGLGRDGFSRFEYCKWNLGYKVCRRQI